MKTKVKFVASAKLALNVEHGKMSIDHVDMVLDVSDNLDKSQYLEEDGCPLSAGSRAITQAFVHGLITNIHLAHEKGWRDSAEHLRFIIGELEKGFVEVVNIQKADW